MWVLICTLYLTVCSYHISYEFQSESTLYSCVDVEEFLARNRHHISSLSYSNQIPTHNHIVHKRTIHHLAKLTKSLSCVLVLVCTVYFTVCQYHVTNDWALLWVLSCTMYLTVCYYHVTYKSKSESTLYTFLNVKEILATGFEPTIFLFSTNNIFVCKFTSSEKRGFTFLQKILLLVTSRILILL